MGGEAEERGEESQDGGERREEGEGEGGRLS